jgi:hypothetical protein
MKRAPRSSLDQLLRSEQTTSTRIHAQARSRARLTTRPLGNATRLEQVRIAAIAFILAGVAPALLMTLYWHDSRIAPMVFAFTLMIALGHTIFLALPLFLIFQSLGWVNFVSCVVLGAVIGAVPESIPICRIVFCAWAWATGQPVISAVTIAATWVSCIKPAIYFGMLRVVRSSSSAKKRTVHGTRGMRRIAPVQTLSTERPVVDAHRRARLWPR